MMGKIGNTNLSASTAAVLLVGWLLLVPAYLITDEGLYLGLFALLLPFLAAPVLYGVVSVLYGAQIKAIAVRSQHALAEAVAGLARGLHVLSISAAVLLSGGTAALRVFTYLKHGNWPEFDGMLYAEILGIMPALDTVNAEWKGIAALLNSFFTLSFEFVTIVFGAALAFAFSWVDSEIKQWQSLP